MPPTYRDEEYVARFKRYFKRSRMLVEGKAIVIRFFNVHRAVDHVAQSQARIVESV
jgi:hypothetical protein